IVSSKIFLNQRNLSFWQIIFKLNQSFNTDFNLNTINNHNNEIDFQLSPLMTLLHIKYNKIILNIQLDLIIKILISKSRIEYGLEFTIKFLLNISKINQNLRDKILHLLINGICLLSKDLTEEIK
ncbi:unnamed protein product, partial [Rotaria sp. Silwood1]